MSDIHIAAETGDIEGVGWDYEVLGIVEDVDVRDLDQGHVVPNMGPANFRGVWYPNLNLG